MKGQKVQGHYGGGQCINCGQECSPHAKYCSSCRGLALQGPRSKRLLADDMADPDLRMEHVEVGEEGCWIWTRAKNTSGYGVVKIPNGPIQFVHRLVYEAEYGPLSRNQILDHLCRNRACCNPDHIEVVSAEQNTVRAHHDLRRDSSLMSALELEGVDVEILSRAFNCSESEVLRRINRFRLGRFLD